MVGSAVLRFHHVAVDAAGQGLLVVKGVRRVLLFFCLACLVLLAAPTGWLAATAECRLLAVAVVLAFWGVLGVMLAWGWVRLLV